ncbi:DUF1622 domain-containing protein [Micromonospora rubida]|uniref:DUF1622 domain-containing protein n=1 Tax=Micromonospora rubida TaxID=2697657 RepID=A0ABW7SLA1_9ACTN
MRWEEFLRQGDQALVALVEVTGALVIFVGAVWAALRFVAEGLRHRSAAVFTPIRLSLGRFLVLGLEFQLAADILRTAVSPTPRPPGGRSPAVSPFDSRHPPGSRPADGCPVEPVSCRQSVARCAEEDHGLPWAAGDKPEKSGG